MWNRKITLADILYNILNFNYTFDNALILLLYIIVIRKLSKITLIYSTLSLEHTYSFDVSLKSTISLLIRLQLSSFFILLNLLHHKELSLFAILFLSNLILIVSLFISFFICGYSTESNVSLTMSTIRSYTSIFTTDYFLLGKFLLPSNFHYWF